MSTLAACRMPRTLTSSAGDNLPGSLERLERHLRGAGDLPAPGAECRRIRRSRFAGSWHVQCTNKPKSILIAFAAMQ
jgi:hypothetical protein